MALRFNYVRYYENFPPLDQSEFTQSVNKISTQEFITSDFIKVWTNDFPESHQKFRRAGASWRTAIGRQLSEYAQKENLIFRTAKRRHGEQVWSKI